MASVLFLVGSTYGNAQQAAEDAADLLVKSGHSASVNDRAELDDLVLSDADVVVICTATIGEGDIPDNLLSLYEDVFDQRPRLDHINYGLIALGDSSYEEFAGAGYLFKNLMQTLGAKAVLPMLVIDAIETPDPEEAVAEWVALLENTFDELA